MTRANPIQTSFNAGEFSPRLAARVDFVKYAYGAEVQRNLLILPQGGMTRRPGTQFVAEVKSSADKCRLVPFEFNTEQAYILEFGNLYIRFYKDQGQILSGGSPYEIVSPYATADLPDLRWAQSADTMYIAHRSYPLYKLTRTGHTSWTITAVTLVDGPWLSPNTTGTTLTPSATSGSGVTISASSVAGINGGSGFQATDVGRLVRIRSSGAVDWGYATITARASTTSVTVTVNRAFGSTSGVTEWQLGGLSATTGYATVVTFFEQRLVLGRDQSFWQSQSADLENFRPDSWDATGGLTVEDDDGLDYTIAAKRANALRWFAPGSALIAGTSGGEWWIKSSGEVITPTDISARQQTTNGSAAVDVLQVGSAVLYVQRAGRKLLRLNYVFETDRFESADTTLLAEHITASGIVEMAYQQEPDSVVWCALANGRLISLTYRPEQDVTGWAPHPLGGVFGSGEAVVDSVAAIPGNAAANSADRDEVWVVVKRTINGGTKRYVEVLSTPYAAPIDADYADWDDYIAAVLAAQTEWIGVDSALVYDGAPSDTISGLDHLEGQTVKVLVDGATHPDCTVTSGAIALDAEYSHVVAGLSYHHHWRSLKIASGAQAGTAVGAKKRVDGVTLVLAGAACTKIGPSLDRLSDIEFREVGDAMDTAVPLFTGERFVEFDGDWGTDPRITIYSDVPLPFTMLAIAPRLRTNDLK